MAIAAKQALIIFNFNFSLHFNFNFNELSMSHFVKMSSNSPTTTAATITPTASISGNNNNNNNRQQETSKCQNERQQDKRLSVAETHETAREGERAKRLLPKLPQVDSLENYQGQEQGGV